VVGGCEGNQPKIELLEKPRQPLDFWYRRGMAKLRFWRAGGQILGKSSDARFLRHCKDIMAQAEKTAGCRVLLARRWALSRVNSPPVRRAPHAIRICPWAETVLEPDQMVLDCRPPRRST